MCHIGQPTREQRLIHLLRFAELVQAVRQSALIEPYFGELSLEVRVRLREIRCGESNPHDAVRTFQKRIVHAHAQDARRISPNRMATVPLGHGDLDWMQLLADFEEIEYRGALSVLGDDRAEVAAGVAFLRRLVA